MVFGAHSPSGSLVMLIEDRGQFWMDVVVGMTRETYLEEITFFWALEKTHIPT